MTGLQQGFPFGETGLRVSLHGSNPKPPMSALGQKRTFCNAAGTGTIQSPHRRETAVIVALRGRAPSRSAAQFSMQSSKPKTRNDHGDSEPTYGNGWAILKTRNQITGAEFIHRGDESTFTAQSG
jgi:hypothetical protein